MAIETVAVTGGNGHIGEAILRELNEHGYATVDLARGKRREEVSDRYFTTDLTTAGEVYGSLARSEADAVVHMGTIPSPTRHPGYVTFESNVMSSYHVLEAATELGLESVCLASSINAMGAAFQDEPMEVEYLPVDEEHPLTPRDPYAISKHALEVTADGFGRLDRGPETISSLRYPWVGTEDDIEAAYADADRSLDAVGTEGSNARDELYSYLWLEDAAAIARRAIEAEFAGHEAFWAVAEDTTVEDPTERIVETAYPEVELREELSGTASLIDTDKAAELLGWEPERSWRDL